jgi:hypothetical protein
MSGRIKIKTDIDIIQVSLTSEDDSVPLNSEIKTVRLPFKFFPNSYTQ